MHFTFIIVEPKVAENIGASARAIKTMGFKSLSLVNPVEYLSGKASWVAHGSYDILESAKVFSSLEEATSGMDIVIGTTARYRIKKRDYTAISELKPLLLSKTESVDNVAIVFGREESGLTNEELMLCDITTSIPLAADFPSLNLAQAVMIFAYELSSIPPRLESTGYSMPGDNSHKALKKKATMLLESSGINRDDAIFGRIMERISLAGDTDIKLMHSVIGAILKKLN